MNFRFGKRQHGSKKARLGNRRKRVLTIKMAIMFLTAIVFAGIFVWVTQLEELKISSIKVEGNTTVSKEAIYDLVLEQISGAYVYFIPRSNGLFFPDEKVKREIRESFFRIKDVSISQDTVANVLVTVIEREPFALWCGETYSESIEVLGSCYFLDEQGYVFAKSPDFSGDIFFKYFGVLKKKGTQEEYDPIGKYFEDPDFFTELSIFITSLRSIDVVPLVLIRTNGFDMDIVFRDGSHMYFSNDQDFATLFDNFESVRDSDVIIDALNRGEILEYLDFRFGNKVFYRCK